MNFNLKEKPINDLLPCCHCGKMPQYHMPRLSINEPIYKLHCQCGSFVLGHSKDILIHQWNLFNSKKNQIKN